MNITANTYANNFCNEWQIAMLNQIKMTSMMLDMSWGNFFTHAVETGP